MKLWQILKLAGGVAVLFALVVAFKHPLISAPAILGAAAFYLGGYLEKKAKGFDG